MFIRKLEGKKEEISGKEAVLNYNRKAKMRKYIYKMVASKVLKLDVNKGITLELGIGGGFLAIEIAKFIPHLKIIGVDLSYDMLNLAKKNIKEAGMEDRIILCKADIKELSFKNSSFDLVISHGVLHHLADPIIVFNEIARVLKENGRFLINDLRRFWWAFVLSATKFGVITSIRAAYTTKEIISLLEKSNLKNWKVQKYLFWQSIYRF